MASTRNLSACSHSEDVSLLRKIDLQIALLQYNDVWES